MNGTAVTPFDVLRFILPWAIGCLLACRDPDATRESQNREPRAHEPTNVPPTSPPLDTSAEFGKYATCTESLNDRCCGEAEATCVISFHRLVDDAACHDGCKITVTGY